MTLSLMWSTCSRHRLKPHYRTLGVLESLIVAEGFHLEEIQRAALGSEEFWFVAVGGPLGIHPEGRQAP